METKTIQTYKFAELKPEIQEKVIEKFKENVEPYSDWYEYVLDDIAEMIKEQTGLNFESSDLFFDWGRGNSIYFKSSEVENVLREKHPEIMSFDLPEKFGLFSSYLGGGMNGAFNESDFDTEQIEFYDCEDEEELNNAYYSRKINSIKESVGADLSKIQEILHKGFKMLWDEYYSFWDDDRIKEEIEINDEDFLEDGSRSY